MEKTKNQSFDTIFSNEKATQDERMKGTLCQCLYGSSKVNFDFTLKYIHQRNGTK